MRKLGLVVAAVAALIGVSAATADEAARTETVKALESGKLADGVAALTAMVAADGANDEARFGLGMVQFIQAIEHLSQGLYKYGLQPPRSMMMPIVRLPVPENPNPEPIDYGKFRAILLTFAGDLATAEATLAALGASEVKIPVNLVAIRYDADGNGTVDTTETMTAALARFLEVDAAEIAAQPMVVAFDRADAFWIRGYCNVLMALSEFLLAHDWHESFDASFHVFFPRAHSPFQMALAPPSDGFIFSSEGAIADLISFLHIRWPVSEPARMAAVRDHLKSMIALSRQDFAAIATETDNDHEWIPNPTQTAVTGTTITAEQIAAWHAVLDKFDALLDGKVLMPHWRMKRGINLRRVFEEPQPFDFVLWITGPAALPYVEDGPVLTSEEWWGIIRAFEGSFGSYAIWFN